jgi:hypothetical protein
VSKSYLAFAVSIVFVGAWMVFTKADDHQHLKATHLEIERSQDAPPLPTSSREVDLLKPFQQPQQVSDYKKLFKNLLLNGPSQQLDALAIHFHQNILLGLAKVMPPGFPRDFLLDSVSALAPLSDVSTVLELLDSSIVDPRLKTRLVPALTYSYDRTARDAPQNAAIVRSLSALAASTDHVLSSNASADLARLEPTAGVRYLEQARTKGALTDLDYSREILNILPALPASAHSAYLNDVLRSFSVQRNQVVKENFSGLMNSFFLNPNWTRRLSPDAQAILKTLETPAAGIAAG